MVVNKIQKVKILTLLYVIYFLTGLMTIIGVFTEYLSFGHGLGDLGMLIISLAVSIASGFMLYFRKTFVKNNVSLDLLVLIIISLVVFYLLLSLSIWRGSELPWNGSLFLD